MRAHVVVLAGIVLIGLAASLAHAARAHGDYIASDPPANGILAQPPTSIAVTFSEAVQQGTPSIRVTNSSGQQMQSGPAAVSTSDPRAITATLDRISPGIYTVTWGVVSAVDGHFSAGSFSFALQNPDGSLPGPLPPPMGPAQASISPLEVAFRFLTFIGLATALGTVALVLFAWLPAEALADSGSMDAHQQGYRALARLAGIGAVALCAGAAGMWLWTLALRPPSTFSDVVGSPFLASAAARLAFGVGLVILLSSALVRSPDRKALAWSPFRLRTAGAFAAAAIVAGSLGTHSAAAEAWWPLGPLANSAHLLGVSLWVGGLLAVLRVRRWLRANGSQAYAANVLTRFSRLAFYSVGLILVAGILLSAILVGSVEGLVATPYGWVILAKISFFAPMVALGAYNRYRWVPAMSGPEGPAPSVSAVTRSVRFEAVLGAAVLLLAAVLTVTVPAASFGGAGRVFLLQGTVEGLRLDFQIEPTPTVPGVYTFTLQVWDAASGAPYNNARNASLTFALQNRTFPPQAVLLEGPHGNHFFVDTPALSMPGTWRIDIRFSRAEGFDIHAVFHVVVGNS